LLTVGRRTTLSILLIGHAAGLPLTTVRWPSGTKLAFRSQRLIASGVNVNPYPGTVGS
jgi:hypothetical protein